MLSCIYGKEKMKASGGCAVKVFQEPVKEAGL
jgi:hypothetical protein